jgi:hypothetical protein
MKSAVVRKGYLDFDLARSVSREFFESKKERCGVKRNDLLINSTGDGTLGRIAVYNQDFPAIVDGHVTIVRFRDPVFAWYAAVYLLSKEGQDQIYRYVNGSSGQVEIYPQDLARLWIPPRSQPVMATMGDKLKTACSQHARFFVEMRSALHISQDPDET